MKEVCFIQYKFDKFTELQICVSWLQKDSQYPKNCHENDWESLPGDGHVAPGPDSDRGCGQARDEHRDELVVVRWDVSLDVGAVQGPDWRHRLFIDPSAYEGEYEAPEAKDEKARKEGDNTYSAEAREQLDWEVEHGGEKEEVLQAQELQRHPENVIELFQQVDQLLHLLPERPNGNACLLIAIVQSLFWRDRDTDGKVLTLSLFQPSRPFRV